MRVISQVMRGIPYFLLKEYLVELGGTLVEDNLVVGEGWRVRLTKMEPYRLFSISVGQSQLDMELEEEIADQFLHMFAMKTLRAGA